MQIKYFVIGFVLLGMGIVWWGFGGEKPQAKDETTPLVGTQNLENNIMLLSAVGDTYLASYDRNKQNDPLTALAIDLNHIIQHETSSKGQERFAKAYLMQLKQLKRTNPAACADIFVKGALRQYDRVSPQDIAKMLSNDVKRQTIEAMKFAVSEIGKEKYPAVSHQGLYEYWATSYDGIGTRPHDIDGQKLFDCNDEIARLEKLLSEPEEKRYRLLGQYFAFGENHVILF